MKFNSTIHHRRSIRLKEYDYTQPGAYFVTLVTKDRECFFGEVINGEMHLNGYGKIVDQSLHNLPRHYPLLTLEAFIVMPNHVHTIILISDDDIRGGSSLAVDSMQKEKFSNDIIMPEATRTRPYGKRRHGLSEIVRALKSFSARRINNLRGTREIAVWQRNFYDHIIRNQGEFSACFDYIVDNPMKWAEDVDNPLKG